ncbi:hypothetical protein G6F31_020435 [Rhizopus arrhizus]|nr:hypothetical protein G6F31_020435 [Rhizopus arrhizus]
MAPSNSPEGWLSSDASAANVLPSSACTGPMRWPTSRTTTPALISASATADTAAPSTPSATRMATLRVATPPSPGLAVSDSVGDTSTSGLGGSAMARGKGSGKAMPNWSATAMASSSDTRKR